MKIIYLIAGTFNAGGMERVLSNKANWLVAHGNEVVIITTDQRGRSSYFSLDSRITTYDLNINYDENNGEPFLKKALKFPVKQWRHRRRLEALLKHLQADVVINMFNNDVSFTYKIHDGSRKILESHFSKQKKLQYGRTGLWHLADRLRTLHEGEIVKKYDRFVVLTHEDKQLWGDLQNIVVIPNARTFESSQCADLKQKRVLSVGRLDYQKGFDRLIDIWQRVEPQANGWQLDIVGSGPLNDDLQKKIDCHGLQSSVHILSPTEDIVSIYLRSSIFVMTSRYEGLPMVLIEAQTVGLPIVAFACPCGPRDIITDNINGFLIEDGDEWRFSEQLMKLMHNNVLRQQMGEAAKKASDAYEVEHIMEMWQNLLCL